MRRTSPASSSHIATHRAAQCLLLVCLLLTAGTALSVPSAAGRSSRFIQFPNELTSTEAQRRLSQLFLKSDELGITHCTLQGVVGDEDVALHIWLRLAPPSAIPGRNRTAIARGFALLQSNRRSIPTGGPVGLQLLQAGSVNLFSKNIYLRSYITGVEYPLNVTLYSNIRYRPWDKSNPAEGWTNHVMDLDARFELHEGDLLQQDFELRADGFKWHCPFLIEQPALGYSQPQSKSAKKGAQDAISHPWVHKEVSSLTNATQVWQVLSPFHRITTHDYATMLWHRVSWHKPLGVTKYLLYVYESLSPLIREPLIQELVTQGHLVVVLYTDMPKHERRHLNPSATDVYTMQVLAYNHAMLALWGTDSLALISDIDEYAITHKPMTLVEAFTACRNTTTPKRPSAGLQLRRTDAVCAPHASLSQCDTSVPGLLLWTNNTVPGVRKGTSPHPLSWHAMSDGSDLWEHHNTKMLLEVNLARDVHVHFFRGRPGSSRDDGATSCVRLLHLVDLYKGTSLQLAQGTECRGLLQADAGTLRSRPIKWPVPFERP